MNNKTSIHWIADEDMSADTRESGRWFDEWIQVSAPAADSGKWMGIDCVNRDDVERARTAMLAYSRRAKKSWKIKTKGV